MLSCAWSLHCVGWIYIHITMTQRDQRPEGRPAKTREHSSSKNILDLRPGPWPRRPWAWVRPCPTPSWLRLRGTRPASHLARSAKQVMMAPRTLYDDGGSQPPYGSKRTSARTQQPRQLSFRQAPALLRRPRHHTNWVPKPLWLPRWHVLRALALLR
jgi:hypothetical protein